MLTHTSHRGEFHAQVVNKRYGSIVAVMYFNDDIGIMGVNFEQKHSAGR